MGETGLTASDVALLNRDTTGGGFGDMGFMWIFALLLLFWGGNGFGGRNGGGTPVTEAGLCDAMNFNNLENSVGRLGDMMNAGFGNIQRDMCTSSTAITAAINQARFENQQCCCETQRAIDGVNYNGALNTAAINAVTTAQTQKIIDFMCNRDMAAQAARIQSLELQQALCGVVRYPNAMTYTAGTSPFCAA
jgi:hypothetical protein